MGIAYTIAGSFAAGNGNSLKQTKIAEGGCQVSVNVKSIALYFKNTYIVVSCKLHTGVIRNAVQADSHHDGWEDHRKRQAQTHRPEITHQRCLQHTLATDRASRKPTHRLRRGLQGLRSPWRLRNQHFKAPLSPLPLHVCNPTRGDLPLTSCYFTPVQKWRKMGGERGNATGTGRQH